jgi:hypothetical protein
MRWAGRIASEGKIKALKTFWSGITWDVTVSDGKMWYWVFGKWNVKCVEWI